MNFPKGHFPSNKSAFNYMPYSPLQGPTLAMLAYVWTQVLLYNLSWRGVKKPMGAK